MSATVWYVSKYVALPTSGRGGTRGFMLMREMVRRGHRAVMITSDSNHLTNVPEFAGAQFTETLDGVDVVWVKTRKFTGAQSVGRILSWLDFEWRLWRLPKRHLPRPNTVIVSSLSLLTVLNGLWLRWRYRCRLVFEVRDIWPLTLVEEGGFSRLNPFVLALGLVERIGYRRADALVGTMPNLVEHVETVTRRHAPVHAIPFGIDPDLIDAGEPLPADWVARHVPLGKFIVCHAGTIGTTNALDTLFACARAMKDRADIHFLLVGEGDLRERYEAACADLANVSFTGPVPKTMVQAVTAHCDVMYFSALPSKVWRYGMSLNKVIDYMLSGKPVVGSYTGYHTMIEDAGAGRIVPAGDIAALRAAIEELAAMPADARAAIGARGRAWLLGHRTWAKLTDDYLHIALPAVHGQSAIAPDATCARCAMPGGAS